MDAQVQAIKTDFRFILIEVKKQFERIEAVFCQGDRSVIKKLRERDDHIDNLKVAIESKSYRLLNEHKDLDDEVVQLVTGMNLIGGYLERVGDFCLNLLDQYDHINEPDVLENYGISDMIERINRALGMVEEGLFKKKLDYGLRICRLEYRLDKEYAERLQEIIVELKKGQNTEDLVTTLFILKYFERLGDTFQNIGESILNAVVGEKFKIKQYLILEDFLGHQDISLQDPKTEVDSILNTWSGCRIAKIQQEEEGQAKEYIFKYGKLEKIQDEQKKIAEWHDFLPDVAPRVLEFQEYGEEACLLVDCLEGDNIKNILLSQESYPEVNQVFQSFYQLLSQVWQKSFTPLSDPGKTTFLAQVNKRLDDVYSVHRKFFLPDQYIGDHKHQSYLDLLNRAIEIEKQLPVRFQVRLHGDMNCDNIFFNPADDKSHYIDLHRSRMGDYLQDVSVFMVSHYRIDTDDEQIIERLNDSSRRMYFFAKEFSEEYKDEFFNIRLALGLARNFVTSTRFQLRKSFAKEMFLRSNYLLERIVKFASEKQDFREFKLETEVFEK